MRLPVFFAIAAGLATPAVAQAPGGQPFRIFFDWAKPELTRDAEAILGEAVAAYQRLRPNRVEVAGHSDRSGPEGVNIAASRRRAQAAKAYLVARGVPASAIAIAAYGESRPIVPTEDGVREAQNRRVEISFSGGIEAPAAQAPLFGGDGRTLGSVVLNNGALTIEAQGLTPGLHGLHLHAVGRCDPPDFTSAGPHWNPTAHKHGRDNPEGPHLGDLPNLEVGADGRAKLTLAAPPGLIDDDGAALVIHAAPDDERTDPSGNSGARVACAAFNP